MTAEIGGFYQSNIYKKEKKNNVLVWVFWEANDKIALICTKKNGFLREKESSVYKAFVRFKYFF